MAFGQKVLSRVKSVLTFDPRSDAPVTRRVAFVIEPNTETQGKAPEAGAAISGAAELILRVETAAQAIWGAGRTWCRLVTPGCRSAAARPASK